MLMRFMKKNSFIAYLSIVVLSMVGCNGEKEQSRLMVVNVLDKEYHDDCHIQGSMNVPFMELEDYAEKNWDKEKTHIVLYCGNYKCTASGMGARTLRDNGFKHVWAYEGGSAEWKHKGFPVVGSCKENYLNDYEEPEKDAAKRESEASIVMIAEDLHKKMQEMQ